LFILKNGGSTWLDIHARLPTSDRLNKVGIECDQLCKKDNETHSHLFFNCEYSDVVLRVCNGVT